MPLINRQIVEIDEEKCDGCGDCVPSCAEGAIQIVDGKAKLIADNLCDGIGNCLGMCPHGAITVHERMAEEFDEIAVTKHLTAQKAPKKSTPPVQVEPLGAPHAHHGGGGCPGSRLRKLDRNVPPPTNDVQLTSGNAQTRPSQLGQWPVQLTLLPPFGDLWNDTDVLIAADCVPFAMPDFHERLLAGKTLAIACPKLDNVAPYIEKLTAIFAGNSVRSISVAYMEVPCCMGIVQAVMQAVAQSGKQIPSKSLVIGIGGTIDSENTLEPPSLGRPVQATSQRAI